MGEFIAVLVILLLGIGAYWSFFTFPRQREFSQRQNMVRSLAEGDEVITAGGLIGRIMQIEGDKGIAHVEIAEGLQVRLIVSSILARYDPEELAKNARKGQEEDTATE